MMFPTWHRHHLWQRMIWFDRPDGTNEPVPQDWVEFPGNFVDDKMYVPAARWFGVVAPVPGDRIKANTSDLTQETYEVQATSFSHLHGTLTLIPLDDPEG